MTQKVTYPPSRVSIRSTAVAPKDNPLATKVTAEELLQATRAFKHLDDEVGGNRANRAQQDIGQSCGKAYLAC